MMGTGPFGLPALERLLASQHSVVGLVTQPPRPNSRRRGQDVVNPMRAAAESGGVPVFDPEKINRIASREPLVPLEADILVVVDYGQILNANSLALGRLGGLNIHGSLLPKYRGAAPINWAIHNGDAELGVSIIQMTSTLDAGPTLAQRAIPISIDETAADAEPKLASLGAELLIEVLDRIDRGEAIEPQAQDESLASPAPRLQKSDGAIDWSRSAEAIRNKIRAFIPWPKSFTFWHRPGAEPLRLIVERVHVEPLAENTATPGQVLEAKDRLVVACGCDCLVIDEIQPVGKRVMRADEFLRGYGVQMGQSFGPETAE